MANQEMIKNVIQLRKSGLTFLVIGKTLSITKSWANRLYLDNINRKPPPPPEYDQAWVNEFNRVFRKNFPPYYGEF